MSELHYCKLHGIRNLFHSFEEAAAILREYRSDITAHDVNIDDMDGFYKAINETQIFIQTNDVDNNIYKPRVIVIEGLDGCGKTSLANRMAAAFGGKRKSTPGAIESLTKVRDAFDKCQEEIVTRAYYMISNYVLMKEMVTECNQLKSSIIYIVDRWCSSTFAYTIGDQIEGDESSIKTLHPDLFKWPFDLMKPTLQLVLLVDDTVRRNRVIGRAQATGCSIENAANQWDNKINKDPLLGRRILEIIKLIDIQKQFVDGNTSPDDVYHQSMHSICHHLNTIPKSTVVFFGTHCSGKKTIGEKLSKLLDWEFQGELGDLLRDSRSLKPGGHEIGDGTSQNNSKVWDSLIFEAETERDKISSSFSRVVETWHIGNLLWALFRLDNTEEGCTQNESIEIVRQDLINKYKGAIQNEVNTGRLIYFLFLDINIDTMKKRRKFRKDDLPFKNEDQDCRSLHQALSVRGRDIFPVITSDMTNIEFQVFDNNADNEEDVVVKNIFDWLLQKRISKIRHY